MDDLVRYMRRTDVDPVVQAAVAHAQVEPLVVFLADATSRSAAEASVSAERLVALPEQWQECVHARAGSAAAALLQLLPRHPIVDAGDVVRLTGTSRARAYAAIDRLVDAGVLRRITESRRDMAWAAGDVLDEADVMVDRLRFG